MTNEEYNIAQQIHEIEMERNARIANLLIGLASDGKNADVRIDLLRIAQAYSSK